MLSLHHVLDSIGLVAPHLHALHKINKQVKEVDSNYTFIIDLKFLKEFNQGNYHMVRLSLQACYTGSHEILCKIDQHAYLLGLPFDWNNCSKFNVKDVIECRDSLIASSDLFFGPRASDPSTFSSTP